MAFIDTDARLKFCQFTGRHEEIVTSVNKVNSHRVEVTLDLPFCIISVGAAVSLIQRSTLTTIIHRMTIGTFLRLSGYYVQILGKMHIKIQVRHAFFKVPVLITSDPPSTADIHLGRDFTFIT